MVRFILRRSGFIVLTLILSSLIIFGATQLLPGDVARVILGQFATEAAIENLREELGLNRPIYVQYLNWVTNFIRGDWGTSMVSRLPVRPLLMDRLNNSIMLAGLAFIFYVPLGILFGVMAAIKREKLLDRIVSGISMAFVGMPEFVTGLLLINFLALGLGLLPANSSIEPGSSFIEALPYLILPAITVSLTSLGYVTRMVRSGTIEVLRSDYVRAAELKGLPARIVLFRHVLRNALLPAITVVAMGIGWLIGGLIVTEQVYGYPGLGRMSVYSIQYGDLPMIQASCMIIVSVFIAANLVADILYGLLNPRIRVGKNL
jgi:peptide/nickel transport system permease protein